MKLNALVPYLIGAALTLVVQMVIQLYVVPRVETRKRREDRWERNVLELGELLTTQVSRRAQEAYVGQSTSRFLQKGLEGVSGVDQDILARERRDQGHEAYQATEAFKDLFPTRVEWLVGRIISFDPKARIIGEFSAAARLYQLNEMVSYAPDHDQRTDSAFEEEWEQERKARRALLKRVQLLADLSHPPRAPLRRRFTKRWRKAWAWLSGRWRKAWAWLSGRWRKAWAWLSGRWRKA